jgi:transcriptional regulator with XRE-family HTH domain
MLQGMARLRLNTDELQRARLSKGWTLRDVTSRTEELGTPVDFGNLARYERGEMQPSPRTLLVLAQALDREVDELLEAGSETERVA